MKGTSPYPRLKKSLSRVLLVKLPGTCCNFECQYCYEHLMKIPNGRQGVVTPHDIEDELDRSPVPCTVTFHGGEPLMYPLRGFREALLAVRRHRNKVQGVKIQTNGSLLTRNHIELFWGEFGDLKIEIGISLDGDREQNKLRETPFGEETYDRVLQAYSLLHEYAISAGLLSVLHRGSLGGAGRYLDMLASIPNVRFVKLNALHMLHNGRLTSHSITPSEYAHLACSIHAGYVERKMYMAFPIEPFLGAMQAAKGMASHFCNFSMHKCNNFTCLYPEGRKSLCDSLPLDEFEIPYTGDNKYDSFLQGIMDKCALCPILQFCRGGCLGIRYHLQSVPKIAADYCRSRMIIYRYVTKLLGMPEPEVDIEGFISTHFEIQ